jgi:hypothetical protein
MSFFWLKAKTERGRELVLLELGFESKGPGKSRSERENKQASGQGPDQELGRESGLRVKRTCPLEYFIKRWL